MSHSNGFVGHNLDCHSTLALMTYDTSCPRCAAIKKVVHLRRKTVEAGCPEGEADAAQAISDSLVAKYGLTRGEVYDRLYAPPPTLATYVEEKTWVVRRERIKRTSKQERVAGLEELG
jgi:hypothetical protein